MMCSWRQIELVSDFFWTGQVSLVGLILAGGITVTDTKTSQALFEIGGVRPFAHLEFAKGFVTFDTGSGTVNIIFTSLQDHAYIQTLASRFGEHDTPSPALPNSPLRLNQPFPIPSTRTPIPTLPSPLDRYRGVIWPFTARSLHLRLVLPFAPGSIMRA